MVKRKAFKRKFKKPRRGTAKTIDAKAKSMQGSWRKYTGTTLTLKDAKIIINKPPQCPYCQRVPSWPELSFDHIQPSSREGPNSVENIVVCCATCNREKGNLTADEFKLLLAFLNDYPIMKQSVLLRLRAGGAALRRRRR